MSHLLNGYSLAHISVNCQYHQWIILSTHAFDHRYKQGWHTAAVNGNRDNGQRTLRNDLFNFPF